MTVAMFEMHHEMYLRLETGTISGLSMYLSILPACSQYIINVHMATNGENRHLTSIDINPSNYFFCFLSLILVYSICIYPRVSNFLLLSFSCSGFIPPVEFLLDKVLRNINCCKRIFSTVVLSTLDISPKVLKS